MTDSVIIGFGYRARSGKDTAIAEIIAKRGLRPRCFERWDGESSRTGSVGDYDVRRYAFADALKREVTAAALSAGGMRNLFETDYFMQTNGNFLQLPLWVDYDNNPDMTDPFCPFGKQRTLLQWWGTEYRRSIDPNYWVDKLAKTIEEEKPQIALISDMRFPNEMDWVLSKHGSTVRVERPGLPPSTHLSETALDDVCESKWSITIVNDSDLETFKDGAVIAFDELMTAFPFGENRTSESSCS